MSKLNNYIQLISNMGWRYISYRIMYELRRKSGLLKKKSPVNPTQKQFISLSKWKETAQPFFFQSRKSISFEKKPTEILKEACQKILNGEIQFFSYQYFDLGLDYDWITNPDNGFKYDINKHWTEVNDYNKEAGDIKYVWEKSRFSFLYTIIRYDYHFDEDHSEFVFSQIEKWMDANPINMGPNYKCSQEMSLRILNWIFGLYFYKNSSFLTEKLFQRILHYIYWQLHHVYHNINFSRIAVRNNHAITETLTLYIVSTLFPQFSESAKWKKAGKKWFEQEIAYQIYNDGTFLQFSMNYNRVVIQLLTWAIRIVEINGEKFNDIIYERAYKSVNFLYQCQENSNGYLPNYGSNDGALFFKLSNNNYRDYRPQLDALHKLLTNKSLYEEEYEDTLWYGNNKKSLFDPIIKQEGIVKFSISGYYLIREVDTLTFIRCGNHKDRPAHADNLHIDIWYKGENLLLDGGTYKYNTDDKELKYFMGTESHNTVMLDDYDQMLKGSRFIWYNWSQCISAKIEEHDTYFEFKGRISCFTYLSKDIIHERIVRKYKNKPEWDITDIIHNKPEKSHIKQIWHSNKDNIIFNSDVLPEKNRAFYSSHYGQKENIDQWIFITSENTVNTKISIAK